MAAVECEGYLTKHGGGQGCFGRKNWKRRLFVLSGNRLTYHLGPGQAALGEIVLAPDTGIDLVMHETSKRMLDITTDNRTYHCISDSHLDATRWMEALRRARTATAMVMLSGGPQGVSPGHIPQAAITASIREIERTQQHQQQQQRNQQGGSGRVHAGQGSRSSVRAPVETLVLTVARRPGEPLGLVLISSFMPHEPGSAPPLDGSPTLFLHRVRDIVAGSATDQDGQVQRGDTISHVNGALTRGVDQSGLVRMLAGGGPTLQLTVVRRIVAKKTPVAAVAGAAAGAAGKSLEAVGEDEEDDEESAAKPVAKATHPFGLNASETDSPGNTLKTMLPGAVSSPPPRSPAATPETATARDPAAAGRDEASDLEAAAAAARADKLRQLQEKRLERKNSTQLELQSALALIDNLPE